MLVSRGENRVKNQGIEGEEGLEGLCRGSGKRDDEYPDPQGDGNWQR